MTTILSVLAHAADVALAGWRFCVALLAGCAAAAGTYFALARPGESIVPAVVLVLVGVAGGFIWERSARKRRDLTVRAHEARSRSRA
jgi:hypothetical protein